MALTTKITSSFSAIDSSSLSSVNLNTEYFTEASSLIDKINSSTFTSTSTVNNVNVNGIALAPTQSMTNGGVKETKPPTTTYTSKSGQPQTTPTARSSVANTQIAKTNNDKVHICDFTMQLDLQVCGTNFEIIAINEALRLESLATWSGSFTIPFMDEIRAAYDTISSWYDMIKQYIDQVKEFIDCVQSIVQAITKVLSFIATLPANVIGQLAGCVAGFTNLLTDAVDKTVSNIKLNASAGSSDSLKSVGSQVTAGANRQSSTKTTTK